MFYRSSKYHFDTVFVILCVIAGATSLTISNTSKTSINQLNNHHRASFMDFILDASLIELIQSSNTINKDSTSQYSSDHKSTVTKFHQQSQTVCAQLSNLLPANQMKFCLKHQDVLEIVLPQVIQLTKKECTKITSNLKWNCSGLDHFLDRSNPLAFTREAALIRSILNASMMYLVVKTCSDNSHHSCGCQSNQQDSVSLSTAFRSVRSSESSRDDRIEIIESNGNFSSNSIDHQDLSPKDLLKLEAGSPLRLTKSIIQRQGCSANIAFANAFSKVFIDSDDIKALNKAYKVLNENPNYNGMNDGNSNKKRLADLDYKDSAFIKWTKSAISLHNNHIGRQMVREATQRRCRCHGLSGVCQFKTCWDQLLDFDTIASRLKLIYLTDTVEVKLKNLGTFESPDLHLAKVETVSKIPPSKSTLDPTSLNNDLGMFLSPPRAAAINDRNIDKVQPRELVYLYESPDYCEQLPEIRHSGVKGRACAPMNSINLAAKTSKKNIKDAEVTQRTGYYETNQYSLGGETLGSCEQLCCNRGYHSELVLDMVTCNCRFKFCCKVDCDQCLLQRKQHYCL